MSAFGVEADGRCRSTVAAAIESCRSTVVAVNESFPLASVPYVISSVIRVCGVLCGHDERWFPCPRRTPFYMPLCERGTLPQERQVPPIRVWMEILP
jgi:hypothetical protein